MLNVCGCVYRNTLINWKYVLHKGPSRRLKNPDVVQVYEKQLT